ncbi:uncharacterized protein LOC62_05G007137 [Vanrija pseudolonga]|uniref:Uncharacterized protein n=1 Tax=Vanrija pseudolonga TaxID=143232 RepID=A0AAF0YBV7_9TREE|nr:hypothetical protein LOC62_05G007137 [Vanrija pseudolonga]
MGFLDDATNFVIDTVQFVLAVLWVLVLVCAVLTAAWAIIKAFLWVIGADASASPQQAQADSRSSVDVLRDMEQRLVRHWEKLTVRLVALDEGIVGGAGGKADGTGDGSAEQGRKAPATDNADADQRPRPFDTTTPDPDPAPTPTPTREAITTALKDIEDQLYAVRRMRAPLGNAPARG